MLAANVRQARLLVAAESPWPVWLIGTTVPQLFRSTVYVFLGELAAGPSGAAFALAGTIVLAVTLETISSVSDIPVVDAYFGTYGSVTRSRVPVIAQYASRTLPLAGRAALESLAVLLVVGSVTGQLSALPRLLAAWWMVPLAIVSSTAFGLVAIAPAIGTTSQDLWHNTAVVALTLSSGAIIALDTIPVAGVIGAFLPLQHAVHAYRTAAAGGGILWMELGLEALIAVGWALAAVIVYTLIDHRGRSRGSTVMAG